MSAESDWSDDQIESLAILAASDLPVAPVADELLARIESDES